MGTTKIVEVCFWCGAASKDGEFCSDCVASAKHPNRPIDEHNPPSKERWALSSWDLPEGGRGVNFDLVCRRAGVGQYVPDAEEIRPSVDAFAKHVDRMIMAKVASKVKDI